MTLTDELKILHDKFKANQAQYDLGTEAAKISALPSKDLLEKYKYLAGEDLGHRPSVFEKTKFDYSSLGLSLSKSFKKIMLKILRIKRVILIMTDFAKIINEFEELSLDSKYNKMKKFTNLLTIFKDRKPKTQKRNSKRSEL